MTFLRALAASLPDKTRIMWRSPLVPLSLMPSAPCVRVLAIVLIAGCAGRIHLGNGTPADRSSPDVVLSGFDQASVRRDYRAMLAYLLPERRNGYRRFFRITRQYEVRLGELEKSVRYRLGEDEAALCRLAIGEHPAPGFAQAPRIDGEIDWSKLEIITDGSAAEARLRGIGDDVIAVLVNTQGGWFIQDYAGGMHTPESLDSLESMVTGLCREIDSAIGEVRSRKINKGNFMRFLKERFDWEPGQSSTSSWRGPHSPAGT